MCASPIPADLRQFSLRVSIRFLFERILAFVGGPSRSSGLRPSASAAPQHDDQDGRSYERFTTRTTSGKSTSQHSRSGLWFSKPLDKYPESEFDLSSGLGFWRPLDKYPGSPGRLLCKTLGASFTHQLMYHSVRHLISTRGAPVGLPCAVQG